MPFVLPLKFKRLHPDATTPVYASAGALCFDLHACLPGGSMVIGAHRTEVVPTALAFDLPPGVGLAVLSRSGLARAGLVVANAPGRIDPDYRGELFVLLHNRNPHPHTITHGDRIAQAEPILRQEVRFDEVQELTTTARGTGGLGSTGVQIVRQEL